MFTKIALLFFVLVACISSCTSTAKTTVTAIDTHNSVSNYRAGFTNDARDTLYLPSNSLGGQICDMWDINLGGLEVEQRLVFVFVSEDEIERLWYERRGIAVKCVRGSIDLSSKQSNQYSNK